MRGLVAAVAVVALMGVGPAGAADRMKVAQAASFRFDIRPQALPAALNAFSTVTGWEIGYPAALGQGVASPGVSGTLAPEEALRRLLAGTGLTWRATAANTVTLERVETGGEPTRLDPVQVEGAQRAETAWGPVDGYVATRSAAGTKSDLSLIETPQTISVITRDQIDAQSAQTVRQVLRYAPGVYFSDDLDQRITTVNSRGFALDQYSDGLRQLGGTWALPQIEPWFVERAEVVAGPASVLYGQASPGGILNFTSKRPTLARRNEVQIQTGSYDRAQGAFDFSGPLDKDARFLYRVAGLARYTRSEVNYVKEERMALAPSFTWAPTADTSLTILSDYVHDPSAGFWTLLPYQGTLLPNRYGKISPSFYVGAPNFESFRRTQYSLGYAFEHRFNEAWAVRQNLRARKVDIDYRAVQGSTLLSDMRTLTRQAYTADENLRTFQVDTQLESRFATGPLRHTVLAGLDYQRRLWDNFTRYGAAPSLDILRPNYNQPIALPPVFQDADQTQNQLGAYVQDQIKWGGLVLLAGGRQDWADTTTDNQLARLKTTQNDQAFTGRVGLLYLFGNGIAPYASYASSFQPVTGTAFGGGAFQPTKGEQWEVGVKYQPQGVDSFMTVSAYSLTQSNVTTPDPLHTGFSVQTGEVRSRGIDVSGVASLAQGLSLRASYSYLDNEITKANDASRGKTLANTPSNLASIWADYTIGNGPITGLGFGGGVKYVGDAYTTNLNTQKIPSFTLADAVIHYDLGQAAPALTGAKLQLNASNLFDKEYVSYCTAAGCRYGMGRTVYATLTYRW